MIVIMMFCCCDRLEDDVWQVTDVSHMNAASNIVTSALLPLTLQALAFKPPLSDVSPLVDGWLTIHVRFVRNMKLYLISCV